MKIGTRNDFAAKKPKWIKVKLPIGKKYTELMSLVEKNNLNTIKNMHEVIIPGPEGRIEGRYNKGPNNNPPLVILLHPHPAHGGNMNNKVIYNCFNR